MKKMPHSGDTPIPRGLFFPLHFLYRQKQQKLLSTADSAPEIQHLQERTGTILTKGLLRNDTLHQVAVSLTDQRST